MKDLGVSNKHSMMEAKSEDTKSYPSMTIDHKALPHLKKHKVGDTGKMTVKYKVTGQQSYKNGESHTNMDITHAEPAKRVEGKSDKELTNSAQADDDKQPKVNQK